MKALALALILLVLTLAGCGGGSPDAEAPNTSSGPEVSGGGSRGSSAATTGVSDEPTDAETTNNSELRTVTIEPSGGREVEVRVEIADNALGRYLGLRNRENLPENRGMLFVYREENQLSFTMEDTLIPLSISFMDSKGRIVDIQDMKPKTAGPYLSAKPAQYALEVNQGFFEERGVEVGDRVALSD